MALAHRMNTKNVSSSGVQVFTHFRPTLGCDDRVADELDEASSAFMKPDGIAGPASDSAARSR